MSNQEREIEAIVNGMSLSQLYAVMVQMKGMLTEKPDQVRAILQASPPFAYALLHAQTRLGMVAVPAPAPPPPPLPVPVRAAEIAHLPADHRALLDQVRMIPAAQLATLSPQEQETILAIRQALDAARVPFKR